MGESEYENEDDPFPKGIFKLSQFTNQRLGIPSGFYVSKKKGFKDADLKEVIIRDLKDVDGEPLNRIGRFDLMRILYVGLSRAEKLLILPKLAPVKAKKGTGTISHINNSLTDVGAIDIQNYDTNQLKIEKVKESALSKVYSYTADYLAYERCPRQYMIYRKYGFVPSKVKQCFWVFGS